MKLITPVRTIALLALFVSFTGLRATGEQATTPEKPVTVFVLRHAETAGSTRTGGDPPLSEEGQARAAAVARLLGRSGATHLFSSEFARTRATIAPLAEALELEVVVVSAGEGERQVEALEDLPPGSVAVVCGHSNTVPNIVAALGGRARDLVDHPPYGEMLEDSSYDRMFAVTLPVGELAAAQTNELRYGAP